MPVLAAVCCERVLGYQRLEGQAEVDDWVEGMVLETRYYSVAASVFAGRRLPLMIFVVDVRWCIGDSEAAVPALRYIAADR